MSRIILGKNSFKVGKVPAVALVNPKYPHNLGAVVRAASCFGINQVWFSGDRIDFESKKGARLPREERMKGYLDVDIIQHDYFFDAFSKGVTPVAVELRDNSESLLTFEHPAQPLYVFGPEDGSIPSVLLRHCHRFVVIPTRHCVNLSAAVYTVLYDRMLKLYLKGESQGFNPGSHLNENRGFEEVDWNNIL